ncbi:D-alanyl-D-alanine carboxypeptidase/D-alanyl-D-alanine-endopeptidase [Qingshengfaniella alkalisoli]|uniref:D-alanyl-D-alanine carboxypeptidase/D-alanyl-D-alanine-endopeptidase n=1 Tax=Qingshengfaniella alkalisoli TaxID=2599296 RepID=A0A5B8I608_9RHOB|nr:D-alanyl-D-alanine carboxypeptidase/D-alanyl-D-alanine-endopeptidase [Qingshengfaniella alkalisoli]QDY68819.1 D-alanyl-D-alanine carboxypeptidase/D-alanyl-D-alanine-endopeptidase [Qingshengfaniella alkalisoli]
MTVFTRRHVLAAMLSGAASPVLANVDLSPLPRKRGAKPEPLDIPAASRRIVAEAGLSGQVCFALADARTGVPIAAHDADVALPPASVAKSITAAYALDQLGPAYRFDTRVIATGPIRDGNLQGDLILAGDGAPDLSSDDLSDLAEQLQGAGLRKVEGDFLVWTGALPYVRAIDPTQPEHLGYNPSVSGLNLNYNRVHFEWRRQGENYGLTMDARTGNIVPKVERVQVSVAERELPVYVYSEKADRGGESWTVARSALGSGGARWLPVRQSGMYAGEVFRSIAGRKGIDLPQARMSLEEPTGAVLAARPSPEMADILRGMLLYSTNLTAEVVGLSASKRRMGAVPDDLAASASDMTRWARLSLGMNNSRFMDHSGLEDTSRVTAADMVAALGILGVDGSLQSLMKRVVVAGANDGPQNFEVRAKTGTLNFVSALAGYIRPQGGRDMVFAIFTADLDRRALIPAGDEENPAGASGWAGRSRLLQKDLVRLWGRAAPTA